MLHQMDMIANLQRTMDVFNTRLTDPDQAPAEHSVRKGTKTGPSPRKHEATRHIHMSNVGTDQEEPQPPNPEHYTGDQSKAAIKMDEAAINGSIDNDDLSETMIQESYADSHQLSPSTPISPLGMIGHND